MVSLLCWKLELPTTPTSQDNYIISVLTVGEGCLRENKSDT